MILVCFAVAQEAAPFMKAAPPRARVLVTGMGGTASRKALANACAQERPEFVLTCGFAGGLNPALEPCTVLYSSGEMQEIQRLLEEAGAKPARFFCSDRVVSSRDEKARLWGETHADAVEMESAHVQELCRESGIRCATIRVVLDPAHADLPLDFNTVTGPDQCISPSKLSWAIARSPSLVPRLLRLGRESRAAAEALAKVLLRVTASRQAD